MRSEENKNSGGTVCVCVLEQNKHIMIFIILHFIGDIILEQIKQLFKINKPFFVVFQFTCFFIIIISLNFN